MPKIVTLKDNNDDIVYPITPIDAVFTDTSVTLENMIDAKADTDLTNVANGSVTTNKIADGTVTSEKIDWTSIEDILPTDYMTLETGYEYNTSYCDIKKFGKLIIVRLQIHVTSGAFNTSSVVVGHVAAAYRPTGTINYGGYVGGQNGVNDSAYFYLNGSNATGDVTVRAASTSNNSYIKIALTYITRN